MQSTWGTTVRSNLEYIPLPPRAFHVVSPKWDIYLKSFCGKRWVMDHITCPPERVARATGDPGHLFHNEPANPQEPTFVNLCSFQHQRHVSSITLLPDVGTHFYVITVKSYSVYMTPNWAPPWPAFSPVTFEPNVTRTSFDMCMCSKLRQTVF